MDNNLLFILCEVAFIDNFGIAMLSAIAKKAGWNTHLTVFGRSDINKVFREIRPKIVCYSSMSTEYDAYLRINKYLKSRYEFISIMGGSHPTFFSEIIRDEHLDYICVGEGELAFQEFLTKYRNGESLEDIKNFCSKTNKNPLRDLIQNLDELPLPDRGVIFDNTELKDMLLKTFMTSRGCPFSCSYCYNATLMEDYKGKGQFVRIHSVRRVMEEIDVVRSKYPLKFIKFEDDLFSISKPWLEEFSEIYRKNVGLPFNCLLRIDLIDRDRIKLLKNANCRSITVAIDSANERLRNEMLNRSMKLINKEITERLLLVKQAGINVMTNIIVGIPGSTVEDELRGVDLNIKSKVDYASSTILVPYPRTAIWYFCRKNNILEDIGSKAFPTMQEKSTLTCFVDKEKDVQWNLTAFYGAMVKFPMIRSTLIWIAKHCKPNILFSFVYILTKTYLLGRYIYTFKIGLLESIQYFIKAIKIEIPSMLGLKKNFIRKR